MICDICKQEGATLISAKKLPNGKTKYTKHHRECLK